jgi:rsbT co-antagonist protein RsbR
VPDTSGRDRGRRKDQRPHRYCRAGLGYGTRVAQRDFGLARAAGFFARGRGHVCSLAKQPLFNVIRTELAKSPDKLFDAVWAATELLDRLALFTSEAFMATREELIVRQQQELLELSTPVVKLWDGILALPIIGTLDSARTQVVMESLLETVVATNSKYAIIDITGVPTVDTLVAQHLLKTITAARLMGAECIISGVRPQIAQTIVHLGINLEDVITKARLSDAFALALDRSGRTVVRKSGAPVSPISGLFTKREE